ncbi:hypothetical protein Ae201684P_007662 [Aphanomyces euteiches]|uniref:THH1/TOM1/TOM3 domain-containing protein n=2 Tax=Aphanomyces euteiches TaxID=100861 RepID=A0A6G0XRV2_9STRA|nr:hypothetical protein Ae201684_001922 [Aphanomyces euteiches]KAH9089492.1 hypothetical protein Ae201684P_007662 [Aphanomyces euteiches]
MHLVMVVYLVFVFSSMCLAQSADLAAVNLLAPKLTIPLHLVIAFVYTVAFASAVLAYKRQFSTTSSPATSPTTAHAPESRWNDALIAFMNFLQIASQSYQAFVIFNDLTRLGAILSYALLVLLCP